MLDKDTELFFRQLRGYTRKPTNWSEAGDPIPRDKLSELKLYSSDELGITYQIANGFKFVPEDTVFLVSRLGALYLVSTEGADYVRYVRYVGSGESGYGYNDAEAKSEGWALFECDDNYLRIQKVDCPKDCDERLPVEPIIPSDYDALTHVIRRASEGSVMHKVALSLHGTMWR